MNAPVCYLCGGRIDADELGTFFWVPEDGNDFPSLQDTLAVPAGSVCCDGGYSVGTPYEHVLEAAADFE